jgi:ferredoxin-NADP reductase
MWRLGAVVAVRDETPRVRTIVLDVPDWPGHRPGQHVDVRLTAEDGYQAERSYSIASPPEEAQLELTVERLEDGEVSTYLTNELREGDQFELRGPIGGYFVWTASQPAGASGNGGGFDGRPAGPVEPPLQLIAGGSGIVPLMCMLRHRALSGSRVPTRLLFSVRSFEELVYREELERLAAEGSGLKLTGTLTGARPEVWSGYSRRIDERMLAESVWPAALRPLVYVCGPTALVETAATILVAQGHEPARVKTERFGPTGGP